VFGTFIDWRGAPTISAASAKLGLAPLNVVVWAKINAEMGSLYRSQHELLPFKKGDAPHVNNIQLGRQGRWRSNVWTYPGAALLDLTPPRRHRARSVPRLGLDAHRCGQNWPRLSRL